MKSFFYLLFPALLCACSGSAENPTSYEIVPGEEESADTLAIFTTEIDFVDGAFYFIADTSHALTPDTRMVHILPWVEEDSAKKDIAMIDFLNTDFDMDENFDAYIGPINVFYDGYAQHLAATFSVVNGVTDGPAKMYDEEGMLYIDRTYTNGYCSESRVDLYAMNWSFNPTTASLNIADLPAYESTDKTGARIIVISESIVPETEETDNSLYSMIEKSVFDSLFKINGIPYTGTLIAYSAPLNASSYVYFELSMLDGKLHGPVLIYDDWGTLVLQERFENGVLAETVYVLDPSEQGEMAKPVIYLYPEKEMLVNVQLDLKGEITHSYPKYASGGWNVKASPDGTLIDENGKEFYALFWEGSSTKEFTYAEGFVIKGDQTAEFLERSLDIIGLTRREANEFIMYWLPQMENNAYNLIHFSTDEYEEIAGLKITPQPESLLRVMMVWSPLEKAINIPTQNLYDLKVERKGFTVVEWGGMKQAYSSDPL